MSKLIRLLIVVLPLGAFLIAVPQRAYACSCVSLGDPLRASPNADAVFAAKVVELSRGSQAVTFTVSMVWKGPETSALIITGTNSMCDYQFEMYGEYLVYAYKDKKQNEFHVDRCGRTMPMSTAYANAEFTRLGAGKRISASHDSAFDSTYAVGIFLLIALVLSILLFLLWHNRNGIRA